LSAFLRFSVSTKVTLALSIGLGILLALGAFGLYSASEFFKTGQEVRRLLQTRSNLETLGRNIESAKSVQLRYQLSADPADRDEFKEMSARVFSEIESLRHILIAPDQRNRIDDLKRAVQARFELFAETAPGDAGAARPLVRRGAEIGHQAHAIVDAIGERERQIARESGERVEGMVVMLLKLAAGGAVIAVVLLLWTIGVINRYERDRLRAESDLANAQERLAFALEGSNSAAWDWNLPRSEIYLSAGWQQILGAEARETTVTPRRCLR